MMSRITVAAVLFFACARLGAQPLKERADFRELFDRYHVEGSIFIYDMKHDSVTAYNPAQYREMITSASTFKIFNSLAGLETGVLRNAHFVIRWDSVKRARPEWNQDLELKDAFRYSAVWYYQEVARRIGEQRMKEWIGKAHYGNENISGGIDRFWLTGQLRISPEQQMNFLRRLYARKLPFSARSMDIVSDIMLLEQSQQFTLRGKTGWGVMNDVEYGWFVGWLEQKNNVFIFVTCIQDKSGGNPDFANARTGITKAALKKMGLIPE